MDSSGSVDAVLVERAVRPQLCQTLAKAGWQCRGRLRHLFVGRGARVHARHLARAGAPSAAARAYLATLFALPLDLPLHFELGALSTPPLVL